MACETMPMAGFGTAADGLLAGRRGGRGSAAETGCRALILDNAFSSLREVFERHAPPELTLRFRFDSLEKIRRCRAPLWQSHGAADDLAPQDLAMKLFQAHAGPKEFLSHPGNHDSGPTEEYYASLADFLKKHIEL